jgi:hypothetical protein
MGAPAIKDAAYYQKLSVAELEKEFPPDDK